MSTIFDMKLKYFTDVIHVRRLRCWDAEDNEPGTALTTGSPCRGTAWLYVMR